MCPLRVRTSAPVRTAARDLLDVLDRVGGLVDPAYSDIADLVRQSPETLISSLIESRYGRRIARIRQDVRGGMTERRDAHLDNLGNLAQSVQIDPRRSSTASAP